MSKKKQVGIPSLNYLAVEISKLEGKKKQVNIAQIKEVLHCLIALWIAQPYAIASIMHGAVFSGHRVHQVRAAAKSYAKKKTK